MKVLLVHDLLRPPSGENTVFHIERKLLEEGEVDVITYVKDNTDISSYSFFEHARVPFGLMWSFESYGKFRRLIQKNKPDIVHFHNIFPLISPSAYYACQAEKVPVVQTLHNHKLFCPCGYLLRNNRICTACIDKSLWHSIKNACYHDSKAHTGWFATMLYMHRQLGTWSEKVDCYITLTNFAKKLYSNAGLPEHKIYVKPNFIPDPGIYENKFGDYGIFVGRLGVEKGLEPLLRAIKKLGDIPFKFVGDGPLKSKLEGIARELNLHSVAFCGFRSQEDTFSLLKKASFLVLPSICYEGFPMVILEAMSLRVPVVTTNLGGLPEIIKEGYSGYIVEPNDADGLAAKMKLLVGNRSLCDMLGSNARKEYEEKYTPKRNFELLMGIYAETIQKKKNGDGVI